MDKELLVKVWIGLVILTGIIWILNFLTNFAISFNGVLVILHIGILVAGFIISLTSFKKEVKFSKHLLLVSIIFLIISVLALYYFTCGFVGCLIIS